MSRILQQKVLLTGILMAFAALVSLTAILNYRRHRAPTNEFSVQSIKVLSATSRKIKQGYDSKVAITIIPSGREQPLYKNAGSSVTCTFPVLIAINGADVKKLPQQPALHIDAAISPSPFTVSFLYNKAYLPPGKIAIRSTFKARYNNYDPKLNRTPPSQIKVMQIEVPIQ